MTDCEHIWDYTEDDFGRKEKFCKKCGYDYDIIIEHEESFNLLGGLMKCEYCNEKIQKEPHMIVTGLNNNNKIISKDYYCSKDCYEYGFIRRGED